MAQSLSSTAVKLCRACGQPQWQSIRRAQRQPSIQRTFSSTTQRCKTIPAFQPTSSPELDDLLGKWRSEVFVPEIVPAAQRKLIYKTSRHPILRNDPGVFYTTNEGEDIRLQPLDRKRRPAKNQSLRQILELMKEPGDWENLPSLVEGLVASKQNPERLPWWPWMIRKTIEAGRLDVILRCAQNWERTHLPITLPDVMVEIIPALHNSAVDAQWKGEELDVVITDAEKVVRMIDATAASRELKKKERDYTRSPEVAGLLLELYASKALNDAGGNDEGGQVLNFAKKVDALWTHGDYSIPQKRSSYTLSWLLPMWNGVRQALKIETVTKNKVGAKLQEKLEGLDSVINQAKSTCEAEAQGRPRRGLKMYNALI